MYSGSGSPVRYVVRWHSTFHSPDGAGSVEPAQSVTDGIDSQPATATRPDPSSPRPFACSVSSTLSTDRPIVRMGNPSASSSGGSMIGSGTLDGGAGAGVARSGTTAISGGTLGAVTRPRTPAATTPMSSTPGIATARRPRECDRRPRVND
jgi:hypothetical protein